MKSTSSTMIKNSIYLALVIVATLSFQETDAAVYVSTIGKPETTGSGAYWVGMPFTTDNSEYKLEYIQATVRQGSPSSAFPKLYAANTDGNPTGAPLPVSFTFSSVFQFNATPITFIPTTDFILEKNAKYVFVLNVPSFDWAWRTTDITNGFDRPSAGSWNMDLMRVSTNGTNWAALSGKIPVGAVAAVGIPEPRFLAFILSCFAIGFTLLRRKVKY